MPEELMGWVDVGNHLLALLSPWLVSRSIRHWRISLISGLLVDLVPDSEPEPEGCYLLVDHRSRPLAGSPMSYPLPRSLAYLG